MANQYSKHGDNQNKAKIYDFVCAHPGCTSKDIQQAFGINVMAIGMNLVRMQHAGMVTSEKLPGVRLLRWTATEDGNDLGDAPVRIIRQQWQTKPLAPQSWAAALGL